MMGLNLSVACHRHKKRLYMLRGDEEAIGPFYREHIECYRIDPANLEVGMDNNSSEPDWLSDDAYESSIA